MNYRKVCRRLLKRAARISCYEFLAIIVLLNVFIIIWGLITYKYVSQKRYTKNLIPKNDVPRKYLSHLKNPTIIYWTESSHRTQVTMCDPKCDLYFGNMMLPPNTEGVYLFYASHIILYGLPLPRNPKKVIWALTYDDSPKNIMELSHEKALNFFNFSSTFSRYSDVPFPLQSIISLENVTSTRYFVETQIKNLLLGQLAPILYLQSNCDTPTERDKLIKYLKLFYRIDSYGRCLKNRALPFGLRSYDEDYSHDFDQENFLKFVAKYKFVVAIESGVCDDYITEKFWRAIHVGVVPIYFGSSTIRDWLPNEKSAILLEDFPTPNLLIAHIDKLMQSDKLYEEYLEHKTEGKISNRRLIEELQAKPYQTDAVKRHHKFVCFLCEKLYEKEKGVNIVTRKHYNCPKPVSALTQRVEPSNSWVGSWEYAEIYTKSLYDAIMK